VLPSRSIRVRPIDPLPGPVGVRSDPEPDDSLFDRVPWVYAFCREHLFRDDTDRIASSLWPGGSPSAGATVVELGCGPGFYARRLAARHGSIAAVGVDRSPAQIADAWQRARRDGIANCRFELGDVTALPYPDATVDAVIAARLLVVVDDRTAVIREMHRVLRPGGRAFIAEPRSALHARLALGAMRVADGLRRLGTTRPDGPGDERVAVLGDEAFAALVASQPWAAVRSFTDTGYRYAVVHKGPVAP